MISVDTTLGVASTDGTGANAFTRFAGDVLRPQIVVNLGGGIESSLAPYGPPLTSGQRLRLMGVVVAIGVVVVLLIRRA